MNEIRLVGATFQWQGHEFQTEPMQATTRTVTVRKATQMAFTEGAVRKVGVNSTRDLERLDQRNVNIEKVIEEKTQGEKKLEYSNLANIINKARRRKFAPQLSAAQSVPEGESVMLTLRGNNFVLPGLQDLPFPMALLNGTRVEVISATPDQVQLRVPPQILKSGANQLAIALDPYAVVNMEIKQP